MLASAVAFAAAAHMTACGNGANDVAGCQELENARCARATECGIDLGLPLHDSNIDAVTSCQLYYQDACLHGFVTTVAVIQTEVDACKGAINASCSAVLEPQLSPQCSWLNPPDAGSDAHDAATVTDVTVSVPDVVVVTSNDAGDGAAAFMSCVSQCVSMDCDTGDSLCEDMCTMNCEEGS
jgi:hypothetical protein